MKPPCGRSSGFTLLEVLLSIAIMALLTTMVYATFVPSLETTQDVDAQRALYRRARIVFGRMEDEIRSAFLGNYSASHKRECQLDERDCPYLFIGESRGDTDELTFTTLAGRPKSRLPQSDQLWVHYHVDFDPETKTSALLREERPIHEGDYYDTKPRISVLFPNVDRFDLRYVEPGTTNSFMDDWDSTRSLQTDQAGRLPRAVELTVEFADEFENSVFLSSLIVVPGSVEPEEGAGR